MLNGAAFVALGAGWRRIPDAPANTRKWIEARELAGLVALTAFAGVLRLYRLDSQLWVDEVFTLLDYGRAPMGEIFSSFPSKNNHLLYSALGAHVGRACGASRLGPCAFRRLFSAR